ncbi:MAG: arsenate reductase [Chloroflexota bacterium]
MPYPQSVMEIQIFGLLDSRPTRAALRFFAERRIRVAFVDLRRRPIAPGELRRFVERLGARSLLDEGSRAYAAGGLRYLRLDEAEIVERLLADPTLLRLPLGRYGSEVAVGNDEAAWQRWAMAVRTRPT